MMSIHGKNVYLIIMTFPCVISSCPHHIINLPFLLFCSSTSGITLQLVVSLFNSSSCGAPITLYKQGTWEQLRHPIWLPQLKECLCVSIEMLLDQLSDRLHEDMDGVITFTFRWI